MNLPPCNEYNLIKNFRIKKRKKDILLPFSLPYLQQGTLEKTETYNHQNQETKEGLLPLPKHQEKSGHIASNFFKKTSSISINMNGTTVISLHVVYVVHIVHVVSVEPNLHSSHGSQAVF
jgi:hypothetical protein